VGRWRRRSDRQPSLFGDAMNAARVKDQSGVTLIELLVVMIIGVIVSGMLVATWINLQKSYAFTTRSDEQRDFARQAIQRMTAEVRDAQGVQSGGAVPAAIIFAYPNEIRFYSTYNTAGASTPTTTPQLTRFIYRVTDASVGEGVIYREFAGSDGLFGTADDKSAVLVKYVANARSNTDVFTYYAYDTTTTALIHSSGTTTLIPASRVRNITITLHVDLNPGKAPNYMDISTNVMPRNVRPF
jgi:prepilin-type N-terminal cleavage/methylation domain-containing protein